MGFFREEGIAVLAYRGASAYEPGNSMRAIAKALELEADGIIIDTRFTKDGVAIAYADEDLEVLGVRKPVSGVAFNELKQAGAVSVATVREVINAVRDKAKLVLIPRDGKGRWLIDLLKSEDFTDNAVIAHHDIAVLSECKALGGNLKVAAIINNPFPHVSMLRRRGVDFIVMPYSLLRGRVVKEVHGNGMEVIAWVINDVATYIKVAALGVDAVATEKPDIRREAEKLKLV